MITIREGQKVKYGHVCIYIWSGKDLRYRKGKFGTIQYTMCIEKRGIQGLREDI
jgi:hypothetical protein